MKISANVIIVHNESEQKVYDNFSLWFYEDLHIQKVDKKKSVDPIMIMIKVKYIIRT